MKVIVDFKSYVRLPTFKLDSQIHQSGFVSNLAWLQFADVRSLASEAFWENALKKQEYK